jgi:NAD(P)-dependent dehydrogenase (short-subunit alcohol dehydrogenase family)
MPDPQRTYAVTGAAGGIGGAICRLLAQRGARVFGLDLDSERLRALPDAIPADVTDSKTLEAAALRIREIAPGGLDGLVNCAGLIRCGALVEMREEDVRAVMDVNVLGAFRVTRALFALLHEKRGRVVNVSSEAARISAPFNGAYSMSKYALEAYSDALRRELGVLGMKVAIIQPGAVRTALMLGSAPSLDGASKGSQFAHAIERIRDLAAKEKDKCIEPEVVAAVVVRALTAKSPRVRYRVGNDPFRRAVEFLPAWLADDLIGMMLR